MKTIRVNSCLPTGIGLLLLALSGCASMSDVTVNPKPLHADAQAAVPPLTAKAAVGINPHGIPAARYVRALAEAESVEQATPAQLRSYADSGVALVQVQCLRWFALLGNRQHVKDFEDANYNVIRQLGTALLGIGKASPLVVATYGATNTAYEGISNNYESAFLGAPNGKKVKQQVMRLLEEQEDKVYEAAGREGATLLTVYRRLEKYADICTHSTAREIVNTALDQGTATITTDGALMVTPNANAQDIARLRASAEGEAKTREAERKSMQDRIAQAEKARDGAIAEANRRATAAEERSKALTDRLQILQEEIRRLQLQPSVPGQGSGPGPVPGSAPGQ